MNYRNMFDLTGTVSVVTGGAGFLGEQFCRGLADFGSKVAVVDMDYRMTQSVAEQLQLEHNIESIGVQCDVADPESVKAMSLEVEKIFGNVDILINNAASRGKCLDKFFATIEDYDLKTWNDVMDVNLTGMFNVAQQIGGKMVSQNAGSIIQVGSIYGATMGSDQRIYKDADGDSRNFNTPPVYSASKAGVVGLTLHLAAAWGGNGVRVNCLTPGGVANKKSDSLDEYFKELYSNRVPLNRMASVEEMIGAAVFLASNASSYVTGQNLFIDGGLSAW